MTGLWKERTKTPEFHIPCPKLFLHVATGLWLLGFCPHWLCYGRCIGYGGLSASLELMILLMFCSSKLERYDVQVVESIFGFYPGNYGPGCTLRVTLTPKWEKRRMFRNIAMRVALTKMNWNSRSTLPSMRSCSTDPSFGELGTSWFGLLCHADRKSWTGSYKPQKNNCFPKNLRIVDSSEQRRWPSLTWRRFYREQRNTRHGSGENRRNLFTEFQIHWCLTEWLQLQFLYPTSQLFASMKSAWLLETNCDMEDVTQIRPLLVLRCLGVWNVVAVQISKIRPEKLYIYIFASSKPSVFPKLMTSTYTAHPYPKTLYLKYTKVKVPHTQGKHTQLSSFSWLSCNPI